MSMVFRCPECGGIFTGSICDYCGRGRSVNNQEIIINERDWTAQNGVMENAVFQRKRIILDGEVREVVNGGVLWGTKMVMVPENVLGMENLPFEMGEAALIFRCKKSNGRDHVYIFKRNFGVSGCYSAYFGFPLSGDGKEDSRKLKELIAKFNQENENRVVR